MGQRPVRSELQEAVEGLYVAFVRYRLQHAPQGCPHCVTDADHARLAAKPLRALTGEDLSRYAFKALTTWGDEADLKHFLPRLLELLSLGREVRGLVDEPVLVGKLAYAGWRRWPEPEQQALDAFFSALWKRTLATHPGEVEAREVLTWLAQAYPDLEPFLAGLRQPGQASVRHLRDLALGWGAQLARRHDRPVYLSEAQAGQVRDLLREPATRAALEAELLASQGEDEAAAAEALQTLEWLD